MTGEDVARCTLWAQVRTRTLERLSSGTDRQGELHVEEDEEGHVVARLVVIDPETGECSELPPIYRFVHTGDGDRIEILTLHPVLGEWFVFDTIE